MLPLLASGSPDFPNEIKPIMDALCKVAAILVSIGDEVDSSKPILTIE